MIGRKSSATFSAPLLPLQPIVPPAVSPVQQPITGAHVAVRCHLIGCIGVAREVKAVSIFPLCAPGLRLPAALQMLTQQAEEKL